MASMASVAVDPADPLALHKLVFLNKVQTLKMYLTPYKQRQAIDEKQSPQQQQHSGNNFEEKGHYNKKDATQQNRHPAINSLDNHLVTPLHLAVMLNRKDMVSILLEAGANPVARSGSGWTPRQEAASLGDRELIEILTRYQRKEFSGSFKTKAMSLVKQLSELDSKT
ncbi:Ankyrin repeat domain-containing protein 13C [Lobosporangium transversale]|nr:Ankyrin repeat domain-containing protein 13C [Lobosporangium transversale]